LPEFMRRRGTILPAFITAFFMCAQPADRKHRRMRLAAATRYDSDSITCPLLRLRS
jgi:hypothetical protein